jgi:AGZA family xanthine/uracil permease-like MFS transporter
MFIVVFVIMLPILGQTGDAVKAWEAGLAWVFIQGFILIGGGFVAPFIRRITPRAALLGTLAGVSIAFIPMRPAMEILMTAIIGLTCLALIMASWFGGVKYPKGLPAGLVAIVAGMVIARGAAAIGMPEIGGMGLGKLMDSFASFGFSVPIPAIGHVFSGLEFPGFILVTAIPFGVYALVEAMDNVESAEVAGASHDTREALAAEGTFSLHGNGAILSGLMLAAIGVFVIERKFETAAAFAAAAAALTFFGFMHGPAVGFAVTPGVALAYAAPTGRLLLRARLETTPVADVAAQPAE